MPKQVTFRLDSDEDRLTVGALIELLEGVLKALREVDPDLPAWEVKKIKTTRPFSFTFSNTAANGQVSHRMNRYSEWSRVSHVNPEELPNEELEFAKNLAALFDTGIKGVKMSTKGARAVTMTPQIARAVATVAPRTKLRPEHTTISGMLDQVTVAGQTVQFRLEHGLTGDNITCYFQPDMLDKVKQFLPSRIEVYGEAKSNASGRLRSIEVDRLRPLPTSAHDFDIDREPAINVTNGVDAADYIEQVRGAN